MKLSALEYIAGVVLSTPQRITVGQRTLVNGRTHEVTQR